MKCESTDMQHGLHSRRNGTYPRFHHNLIPIQSDAAQLACFNAEQVCGVSSLMG